MREILKTLAGLCAVLFVFAGVAVLLLFNIERKAFSSATYKQAFENQGLYERMPSLLAAALSASIAQTPGMVPALRELTAEEWQVLIASLLPPAELRVMTDQTLDATFDYLNFRRDSVVISLLPVKAQLAGEAGVRVVRQFLAAQPACTVEQLGQMALGLLAGDIALCNPPEEAMGLLAPFIQSQLQAINMAFPNEIALVPAAGSGTAADPRMPLQWVRSAILFSPFFLLVLLLAIVIFAVRSFRDLLVWWGWPFLLTGLTAGLIALVGSPLVGWFLQLLIQTQGVVILPPLLAGSLGETARAVSGQMLVPVAVQGFLLGGLGAFMVILGVFLGRRSRYVIVGG